MKSMFSVLAWVRAPGGCMPVFGHHFPGRSVAIKNIFLRRAQHGETSCCSPHFDRTVFQESFQWKHPSKFPRLPRVDAGISR